jgi:hypothetical protein
MVKRTFYHRTNIISILQNNCFQVVGVNRLENDAKRNEQKQRSQNNDVHYPNVNGGAEADIFPEKRMPEKVLNHFRFS